MRIFIDGEEHICPGELGSKEELFSRVKEEGARRGHVVRSIAVDGTVLDEEAFLALAGGGEVHFETVPVRDLVLESLSEGARYMEHLSAGLAKVADMLEADKTVEGLDLLRQAAEGIGWSLQVLHNSQVLLGVSDHEVGDGKVGELKTTLMTELEKASGSIESGKPLELSLRIRTGVLPNIQRLAQYMAVLLRIGQKTVQ